jgi:acyl carrier protein
LTADDVARGVHRILSTRDHGMNLADDLPLGATGLGLDSIALVEVLLECEDAFGVSIATELLAGPNVTIGSLIERIGEALTRG